jgi:tyrosyl-tRNA synthetase
MGKSFDNTVDILLSPEDMFGKVMSMADDVMPLYFEVLTDVPMADITEFRHILSTGQGNPMDIKKLLAGHVVTQFISADAAVRGRESFERQFQRREVPDEMPEYAISQPTAILDVLVASNLASSKSEARRLVDGGGVKINGEKVAGYDTLVTPVAVIQKGPQTNAPRTLPYVAFLMLFSECCATVAQCLQTGNVVCDGCFSFWSFRSLVVLPSRPPLSPLAYQAISMSMQP